MAKVGAYGKTKAGVVHQFIENGIVAALQGGVLEKKDARDFGETTENLEKDEDD